MFAAAAIQPLNIDQLDIEDLGYNELPRSASDSGVLIIVTTILILLFDD
jgi:hypothetical protein